MSSPEIKKVTFTPEPSIVTIGEIPFPDDKFGVWTDKKHHYIGNSKVEIDNNGLIIEYKKYKGTHGL